jgi:hypothetical protein
MFAVHHAPYFWGRLIIGHTVTVTVCAACWLPSYAWSLCKQLPDINTRCDYLYLGIALRCKYWSGSVMPSSGEVPGHYRTKILRRAFIKGLDQCSHLVALRPPGRWTRQKCLDSFRHEVASSLQTITPDCARQQLGYYAAEVVLE